MTAALGIILRGGVDSDAARFFAAAGITSSQEKNAVNRLVKNLKAAGLWSLMVAIYPFVGATSTTTAQNLVSTAYPVTWFNSPGFSATGVTGNGTNATGGMTGLGADALIGINDCTFGVYTHTVPPGGSASDFGGVAGGNFLIIRSRSADTFDFLIGSVATGAGPLSNNLPGLRTIGSNGTVLQYQNAVVAGVGRAVAGGIPANLAFFTDTGASVSPATIAFGFVSRYLSAAQNLTLYNIVQAFQSALGRAV